MLPHVNYTSENGLVKFSGGYEVEILKILSAKFNFSYELLDCEQQWGSINADGTWTGVVGKLVNKVKNYLESYTLNNFLS